MLHEDENDYPEDEGLEIAKEAQEDAREQPSKTQKRIDGLIAERAKAREDATRMAAELDALRSANLEREKASRDDDTKAVKNRIADLRSKARKASENGNFDEEDKYRDALLEAEVEFVERKVERKSNRETSSAQGDDQTSKKQQSYVSPQAVSWGKKNESWMNKPGHARRSRMANQVFQDLVANEGFSPDDDDTYSELDLILNRMFDTKPKAPPRGPASGSEGRNPERRGKSLSKEDKEMMREMNLDPANKIHAEEWIKQNRS